MLSFARFDRVSLSRTVIARLLVLAVLFGLSASIPLMGRTAHAQAVGPVEQEPPPGSIEREVKRLEAREARRAHVRQRFEANRAGAATASPASRANSSSTPPASNHFGSPQGE